MNSTDSGSEPSTTEPESQPPTPAANGIAIALPEATPTTALTIVPETQDAKAESSPSERMQQRHDQLETLAIDIGGTGLKAAILDSVGKMKGDRLRIPTPYPCPPEVMVNHLLTLVAPLGSFDRISIGFPGVVRNGRVLTAPHFGTDVWRDFPLCDVLAGKFDKPARLLNDAEVQGFGVIEGTGLELALTLGTGAGTALFRDGRLMPHLELAHHPVHGTDTYNDYIGNAALQAKGRKRWNKRVLTVIGILESLLHYDRLYLGGGNAHQIKFQLPERVVVTSNDAGLTGGFALWRDG